MGRHVDVQDTSGLDMPPPPGCPYCDSTEFVCLNVYQDRYTLQPFTTGEYEQTDSLFVEAYSPDPCNYCAQCERPWEGPNPFA